jgi:hypothetical protein
MNQNLANSKQSKFKIWQSLCKQSIINQQKSFSPKQHLHFLNALSNGIHAQILMQELNGKSIYKIKPGLVSRRIAKPNGGELKENYYQYGHIKIDNQPIRLSSCLSHKRQIIQFPIYEQQFLKYGQYTFFTCGDMYLLVINSLFENIMGLRKTEKGNYELNVSTLFEFDAVYKFGLIDFMSQSFTNENGKQKITVILPPKYLMANIKGCITGTTPHYILARLENSGNLKTFDYEMWTNYRDIYFAFKNRNNIKQWNAYRLQADKNTRKVLNREEWEFTNLVGKAPGIVKYNDKVHFMIFNWQKINDLEKIRIYCHKIYNKYFKNK